MDIDWDRQQSNIDLMVGEMRAGKYNSKAVKVAIIDTACTADKRASDRIKGNIVLAEMPEKLTQPPHCTMVASRLTMASPGSEIKNWPIFERPGANASDILKAATIACSEGYQVINLSAVNEGGPLLAVSQHVRAALEMKGCILVQASGNDQNSQDPAIREQLKKNIKAKEIEWTNYLTVGANSVNRNPADFSVPAVVRAPGLEVPAVNEKGDLTLASGTSFAAPTVSGIVKNVLTVLKASPQTKKLEKGDPAQLAQLAAKIVKASAFERTVDGYRAIVLAKAVGISGKEVLKDSFSVQNVFNAEAGKLKSHGPCKPLACAEKKTCYNDKRKFLSLVPDNPTQDEIEDLMDTASESLAKQWAIARTKLLGSTSRLRKTEE